MQFCKKKTSNADPGTDPGTDPGPDPGTNPGTDPLLPLSGEFVAEAVDGEDVFRGLRVALDLLTQTRDVHVNGPRQRRLVVAPHVRQQRLARQRRAAMLDEVPQQLELERRQLHGLPRALDLGAPEVDDDLAEPVAVAAPLRTRRAPP